MHEKEIKLKISAIPETMSRWRSILFPGDTKWQWYTKYTLMIIISLLSTHFHYNIVQFITPIKKKGSAILLTASIMWCLYQGYKANIHSNTCMENITVNTVFRYLYWKGLVVTVPNEHEYVWNWKPKSCLSSSGILLTTWVQTNIKVNLHTHNTHKTW